MKTLKGRISIGRMSVSNGDCFVSITINDETSSCQAVKIDVPMLEFANALMNLSEQKCEYSLNESGNLGKTHEHKIELVPFDCYSVRYSEKKTDARIKKAVKLFEVDGWRADLDDLTNPHKRRVGPRTGTKCQEVVFRRFV